MSYALKATQTLRHTQRHTVVSVPWQIGSYFSKMAYSPFYLFVINQEAAAPNFIFE